VSVITDEQIQTVRTFGTLGHCKYSTEMWPSFGQANVAVMRPGSVVSWAVNF